MPLPPTRKLDPIPLASPPRRPRPATALAAEEESLVGSACTGAGTSSGINIAPGSEDDGWVVPHPATLSDGTTLQLYKDGEALRAAYEAIRFARWRVCIEVYIFADDPTGHAFAALLCHKARQGVKVFVIYDSFGSRGFGMREPEMFAAMRTAGVQLQQFHPMRPWECRFSWRPLNRDHRKLLLVDGDIAGVGGLNIGAEYAGSWVTRSVLGRLRRGKRFRKLRRALVGAPCDYWRDNAVGIRGPAARFFFDSFMNTWRCTRRGGRIRRAEYRHGAGTAELGVLASVPTINSPLRPMLSRLMRSATQSILMTMAYFAPDDELVDTLCQAARSGRRVRLMLPGRCDVPVVRVAARSFYQRMLECGIEIYERQGVVLHAKTMVIDGKVTLIGSTNLDYRSTEFNLEISAIVRSEAFGQSMLDLFENDIRYARRITLDDWRSRPTRDRVIQWMVSRARRLL